MSTEDKELWMLSNCIWGRKGSYTYKDGQGEVIPATIGRKTIYSPHMWLPFPMKPFPTALGASKASSGRSWVVGKKVESMVPSGTGNPHNSRTRPKPILQLWHHKHTRCCVHTASLIINQTQPTYFHLLKSTGLEARIMVQDLQHPSATFWIN